MSSVRMCDDCGFIFSENAEGWGNGTVNKMTRNPNSGRIEPKQVSVDYCPECVEKRESPYAAPAVPPTILEKRQYNRAVAAPREDTRSTTSATNTGVDTHPGNDVD